MTDWYEAKISAAHPAADGLTSVQLDVGGTPLAGTHLLPGQYVKLALEGTGEAFFAIASPPNANGRHFELLVKRGSPLADALCAAPVGRVVRLTAPSGKGFPLERGRGKHVLLFATGSGISPIRSTIEAIRQERGTFKSVTLYFGVRTPSSFAYETELSTWEKDGVRVIRTVSQPGASGWTGLTGYVQAHIGEIDPATSVAFLCGQKEMVKGVTEALVTRGLPKDSVFLNF